MITSDSVGSLGTPKHVLDYYFFSSLLFIQDTWYQHNHCYIVALVYKHVYGLFVEVFGLWSWKHNFLFRQIWIHII